MNKPVDFSPAGGSFSVNFNTHFSQLTEADKEALLALVESLHVSKMSIIDEKRKKGYEEDGGYYFSQNNWDEFVGANGKEGYNRAYIERSRDRGTYGMYALSYKNNPIYNAWYSKSDWATRFAKEHPNETFREPYDDEYPLLDSIPQRLKDGNIRVSLNPTDDDHSVPKSYVDRLITKLMNEINDLKEDVFIGTDGLSYKLSSNSEHYICTGLGTVPEYSDISIAGYHKGLPVKEIGAKAFTNKHLNSIRIPNTIVSFGADAFGWSGPVDKVYIRDVEQWANSNFNATSSPVTTMTNEIYIKGRKTDTLTIPEGVKQISSRAFMHWKQFKSIILPSTLETINDMAFQYCAGLETLTIPSSVKFVGSASIDRCTSLKSVLFEGKPSTIAASVFDRDTALERIFVKWGVGEVPDAPWAAPNATVYYYSETEPTDAGDYWHYVDGVPTVWEFELKETEGLEYALSGGGNTLVCVGIGSATNNKIIFIPDEVNGKRVEILGVNAFANASNVTTVILPRYLIAAMGGSLSSTSIKKVICRTPKEEFEKNEYIYHSLLATPNNSISYNGIQYINDGASAFIKTDLQDAGEGYVYVGRKEPNTTLSEIHLPWNEDNLDLNMNSPWDAVNATIIYESEESLK